MSPMMRNALYGAGIACCWMVAQPVHAEMSVTFGGRIQVDAALYDEDNAELGSGTEFRRVRLFAEGAIDEDWEYKLQFDFADGDVNLNDAYIEYGGFDFGSVKIGHFKQPFSLEEMTSSKYITFMERGLPNVLATSRRVGIGLTRDTGLQHFAASVYGDEAGDTAEDEGIGAGLRYVQGFKGEEDSLFLIGGALAYEEPRTTDAGSDTIRIRQRPESHVTSTRLVDTGDIPDVDSVLKFNIEAAAVLGSVSFQGEYLLNQVDTVQGSFDFDGYYVYGSWFPGGQSRPYKSGAFQRLKADHAWELGIRFSSLNLNDGAINGGEEDNITLGVNYYVNPYLRFMANYVIVDSMRFDPALGMDIDDDPNVFQVRASMDFKR